MAFRKPKQFSRVPNRFFGIRDLAYFKARIRDFEGMGDKIRDSQVMAGTRDLVILTSGNREMSL